MSGHVFRRPAIARGAVNSPGYRLAQHRRANRRYDVVRFEEFVVKGRLDGD
jgi:hypothetical protein